MKNYKYIGLFLLSLGVISCDVNNDLDKIEGEVMPEVQLSTTGLDFSNYVAIGASFTAGFTDNALFIKGQENSFPNILSTKFKMANGGEFKQPLMADNNGGLLFSGVQIQGQRLYFNGAGPTPSTNAPTTETTNVLTGGFNNYGIPGAKSFHLVAPGYGNLAGVPIGAANPYYARIATSSSATVLGDALAQSPTFFTLSEVGGNDVLGYAIAGGNGVDQSPSATSPTGNLDPSTYGGTDITNPLVFKQVFESMVAALTTNGAKGVIANVPYITSLAHFKTVPFNPVPMDEATSGALNAQLLGPVKQILTALGAGDRLSLLEASPNNALLIKDEDLTNFSAQISGALQGAGIPAAQAGLMGFLYGQARHATSADLFVLPVSSLIGTATTAPIPAPFNTVGVTYPLEDKWVLTPEEQTAIKTATDAYNTIIEAVANSNENVALVDFKGVLQNASTGVLFDAFTMNTSLVSGGLISLDGIHLTGRGYALMANEILEAIDIKFGSNFTEATNGLAKAKDYPTNYPASMN